MSSSKRNMSTEPQKQQKGNLPRTKQTFHSVILLLQCLNTEIFKTAIRSPKAFCKIGDIHFKFSILAKCEQEK